MPAPFEAEFRDFGRRVRSRILRVRGRKSEAAMLWAWTIQGWSTKNELRALYRAVCNAGGHGDVAEIGSWKGRSTIVLARALIDSGIEDARLWAIDHHVGSNEGRHRLVLDKEGSTLSAFRRNLARAGVESRIQPLVMPSEEAAKELSSREVTLRLVFIDGAHEEASVRRDIRAFLPLLSNRGLVALHDCDPGGEFPGVWRAYESELAPLVDVVDHTDSLLVVRRKENDGVV